jgi:hypothetical protein
MASSKSFTTKGSAHLRREIGSIAHAFGLEQVTVLMLRHNFETGSRRKSNHRNERISESNAIHIVATGATDEIPRGVVASEKRLQHRAFHLLAGVDFLWRADAAGFRGGLNKAPNEPAPEPAGNNFLHLRTALTLQRSRDRGQIHLVRDRQMLKALADAPCIGPRPPIQLFQGECFSQLLGAPIGGVQLGNQAPGPAGQRILRCRRHAGSIRALSVDDCGPVNRNSNLRTLNPILTKMTPQHPDSSACAAGHDRVKMTNFTKFA